MSKRLMKVAVGLLAAVSVNAVVVAEEMGEVTVQASRVVKKTIGTTASGIPIEDISLSYGVSTAGLDLSSSAGASTMPRQRPARSSPGSIRIPRRPMPSA